MSINALKISAGITLYNPTFEEIENVIKYASVFDKVYVYDNSVEEYDRSNLERSSVEIISQGSNDGVGKACRVMTEQAKQDQFDFIMLFDQDSKIDRDNIMRIIEFIKKQEVEAMIYCPQIVFNEKTDIIKGGYK